MAKLYNLAAMTVTNTGVGPITLGTAATIGGVLYLAFATAGAVNGETIAYSINDVGQSEQGTAVYSSAGPTITRTPVTSTNGNAPINVTTAAIVRISPARADIANLREDNVFTGAMAIGGTLAVTGASTFSADVHVNGDVYSARAPDVGVVFLGSSTTTYVYNSGASLVLTGKPVIITDTTASALTVNGGVVVAGALNSGGTITTPKINVGGTDLVGALPNTVSIGGNAISSLLAVGQDSGHHIEVLWNYNPNPANGSAAIATFGYGNNLDISAKELTLQVNSGLPTRIGGSLSVAGVGTFGGALNVTAPGSGWVGFTSGDALHTGYVHWFSPAGARTAYMGYDPGDSLSVTLSGAAAVFSIFNGGLTVAVNAAIGGWLSVGDAATTRANLGAQATLGYTPLNIAGGSMTGQLILTPSGSGITSGLLDGGMQVIGGAGIAAAYISFHMPGIVAAQFGMAGDGNMYIGGFSLGAVQYQLWSKRDFNYTPVNLAGGQTITNGFNFTPPNLGTAAGTVTPNPLSGNYQYITNNGAFTLAIPSTDCAIDLLVVNGASAGSITFTGYWVSPTGTGDLLNTVNGQIFCISIRRILGMPFYIIKQVN